MGRSPELAPVVDRVWLESEAARSPLVHAYPLWDLLREPTRVRFVSARAGERTVGYLCLWLARPDRPIVHWYGPGPEAAALLAGLPRPPFVAVVPPETEPWIAQAFPGTRSERLLLLERPPGPIEAGPLPVRPLLPADRPTLEALASSDEPELVGYPGLDVAAEPVWGAFEGGRLLGVARASVRLPRIWLVGGVYVRPEARGRGWGRALVAEVIRAAERAGAPVGLYAREEAAPARRLYEALGFRTVGERRRLDVPPEGN